MKLAIQNIVCIGAGYVGGPTMAVIADRCPSIQVTVIDRDPARIAAWNSATLPVFEPGLDAVVQRCRGRNLHFLPQDQGLPALQAADAIFIAVNTPTKLVGDGAGKASDLSFVEACARYIAENAAGHTIVIEKSTMPVRAADAIKRILKSNAQGATFDILSNPEFLAEGTAIRDLEKPDRVLIGGERPEAIDALAEVYALWVNSAAIIRTNLWSAELSKLAANAFLAQRVSSINAISSLCEATEADVDQVAKVLGSDSRIGPKFLKASVGFGGSCFKKDVLSLVYLCEFYGLDAPAAYWQAVLDMNEWQKRRVGLAAAKHAAAYARRIAVLGLAFKKDTNDFRETAAIDICNHLLAAGFYLSLHDYRVDSAAFARQLSSGPDASLAFARSPEEAIRGADSVLVLTEWDAYGQLDWAALRATCGQAPAIFDGRNIVNRSAAEKAGFTVHCIGKA